jgi:diguanylate cyclase (GGDEF)-like protein
MEADRSKSGRSPRGRAPLAIVATRIVQEALREDISVAELARMASSDPAFALRVVSTVNSPLFGVPRKVTDLAQACSLLGARGLRNLALGLIVTDMVPKGDGRTLLGHCIRRAVASRLIAEKLGERSLDEYFTAGLLLEIGLLVLARDDMAAATEIALVPAPHRPLFERARGSEDHTVTGARIAAEFKLPELTVEAVAHHHDKTAPEGRIARVVWAAEKTSAIWEGGDVERARAEAIRSAASIGVGEKSFLELLEAVPGLVGEAASMFEAQLASEPAVAELVADANRQLVLMNQNYEGMLRKLEELMAEKARLAEKLELANRELTELACTDALTGLLNRRAFAQTLERDLSRADRSKTDLTLALIDIDHFKQFNDSYGHQLGDDVLKTVSRVLLDSIRSSDVAARFGGEEFVVILPATDMKGAGIVAERIRAALAGTVLNGPKGPLKVTASVGLASVCGPGCRLAATSIIGRADAALYDAKRAGRNRVAIAA